MNFLRVSDITLTLGLGSALGVESPRQHESKEGDSLLPLTTMSPSLSPLVQWHQTTLSPSLCSINYLLIWTIPPTRCYSFPTNDNLAVRPRRPTLRVLHLLLINRDNHHTLGASHSYFNCHPKLEEDPL
ncbi:hypothetical protein BC827DRAFT_1249752 [Russula dissimulans]|nr:hypothetical protein BC827DRAFT_1249752 [Russula dissimulans]